MNSEIPRRIIHVWGGGERDLSLSSEAAIVNVRLLNPDFEYLFFDDDRIEDFTNEHYPEYQSVFQSFRVPIQRYDFFRYLAVYHFGGFYLDLDVFLASSLSDLLNFGCVFPFEELAIYWFLRREYGMDWGISNYAFGAAPRHPFVHAIIRNCVRAQKDSQWVHLMMRSIPRMFREEFYVLCTTGPGLVSRTLAEYPDAANQVKVLFPENVCDKNNWNLFGKYGAHLRQGKWRGTPLNNWQHLKRFIGGKWFVRLQEKQMKASRERGPKRSL
jgi:mannosyltransferase OCH1-like enzyme